MILPSPGVDITFAFALRSRVVEQCPISALGEKGSARLPSAGADSAAGKLDALAKQRAEEKGESFEKAYTAISKAHPDLYNQADRERQ